MRYILSAMLLVMVTAVMGQQPIPLEPGKALRIQIITRPSSEPGTGVIIRVEIEKDEGRPADRLETAIHDLYTRDSDKNKAAHAKALSGLYEWAAKEVMNKKYTTAGDFRKAFGGEGTRLASDGSLPVDALLPIRQVVRDELRKVLPAKADAELDGTMRSQAAALFKRLADITDRVGE